MPLSTEVAPLRLLGFPASSCSPVEQYAPITPSPACIEPPVQSKQVDMSQEALDCMVNAAKRTGSYAEWFDLVCSFDVILCEEGLLNQIIVGETACINRSSRWLNNREGKSKNPGLKGCATFEAGIFFEV